jgi:hypothetical protein
MRPLYRLAYRAILCLHPYAFRAEFGDEMLWIFEEEARNGSAPRLLLDGLLSIVIQNTKPRIQQVEAEGPYYREIDSTIPAERFAQAGLVVLCCSLSLSLFLSMVVPRVAFPVSHLLYHRIGIFSMPSTPHAKIQP